MVSLQEWVEWWGGPVLRLVRSGDVRTIPGGGGGGGARETHIDISN